MFRSVQLMSAASKITFLLSQIALQITATVMAGLCSEASFSFDQAVLCHGDGGSGPEPEPEPEPELER